MLRGFRVSGSMACCLSLLFNFVAWGRFPRRQIRGSFGTWCVKSRTGLKVSGLPPKSFHLLSLVGTHLTRLARSSSQVSQHCPVCLCSATGAGSSTVFSLTSVTSTPTPNPKSVETVFTATITKIEATFSNYAIKSQEYNNNIVTKRNGGHAIAIITATGLCCDSAYDEQAGCAGRCFTSSVWLVAATRG